jgi:MFS transporter, DHA1 family, tetracycline resistance protein
VVTDAADANSDRGNSPGQANTTALLPILSVNFVGTLGFSVVLPFLVFLVTKWGGNAFVYGMMGATYSFFQLIGAPILGRWSDRYGRRKVLLLSQVGTLLSWAVFLTAFFLPVTVIGNVDSALLGQFTLTLPLVVIFFARAADGITGGNVSVANAYLADITDESRRSENFGRMAISGNLGFVIGPALAGLLGATVYGELLPVFAALLISLTATLIIAIGLKDSRSHILERYPDHVSVRKVFGQEQKDCFSVRNADQVSVAEILKLPGVTVLLVVYFLVMLGFSFFYIGFPIHAVQGLNWSVMDAGTFFAAFSLALVIVQGPVLARVSRRVSDRMLIVGGSLILAGGFLLLLAGTIVVIYGAAMLIALGNGLMWPSVMAVLSRVAGDTYQGAVQGFASSAGAIASITGLILGGFLYNWVGVGVFAVSAATILVVSVVAACFGRK